MSSLLYHGWQSYKSVEKAKDLENWSLGTQLQNHPGDYTSQGVRER